MKELWDATYKLSALKHDNIVRADNQDVRPPVCDSGAGKRQLQHVCHVPAVCGFREVPVLEQKDGSMQHVCAARKLPSCLWQIKPRWRSLVAAWKKSLAKMFGNDGFVWICVLFNLSFRAKWIWVLLKSEVGFYSKCASLWSSQAVREGTTPWYHGLAVGTSEDASQALNSKELQQLAIRLAVLRSIIKEPYRPNLRWAAAVLSNHP